ncbi:hypothetical protein ABZ703_22520, partial [Streptomyces massasporeus]
MRTVAVVNGQRGRAPAGWRTRERPSSSPGSQSGTATLISLPAPVVAVLVLAAAPDVDRERFFRQLMVYGGIVVAVVPAAAWPVMAAPG